jgi:hypothetical protein
MNTSRCLNTRIFCVCIAVYALAPLCHAQGTEPEWRRLLDASETEQRNWIREHLCKGMPPSEAFGTMILNRSSTTLPVIEGMIEEVLRPPSRPECFSGQTTDLKKFAHVAALSITEAGNEQSLVEASKLIKLDDQQFGWMVERILLQAETYRNPFVVAYQGLELNDPAVGRRIAAWAQTALADRRPPNRNFGPRDPEPVPESEIRRTRRAWAEAMVERYGGVVTETNWANDPIVVGLTSAHARALHDEVLRASAEAVRRRSGRR